MDKDRRPEDWGPEEKLQAVFDAQGLDEQELGEFLRKRGLHSRQIEEWRKEALALVVGSKPQRGRPAKDPELVAALEENKQLKRDLRRKEKALAEQTALVILQKKVQALWGDVDDE
jgi:transposase-like protein